MTRILAALVLLAAPLAAQAASFTHFGCPCAYLPPPLQALSLPRVGTIFTVETLTSGPTGSYEGGTASALLVGTSRTSWRGQPLPMSPPAFAPFGIGACGDLSVSVDHLVEMPFTRSRQPISTAFAIPSSPALIGVSFYLQAVDYRANRRGMLGLTFGEAGEARIGT